MVVLALFLYNNGAFYQNLCRSTYISELPYGPDMCLSPIPPTCRVAGLHWSLFNSQRSLLMRK